MVEINQMGLKYNIKQLEDINNKILIIYELYVRFKY